MPFEIGDLASALLNLTSQQPLYGSYIKINTFFFHLCSLQNESQAKKLHRKMNKNYEFTVYNKMAETFWLMTAINTTIKLLLHFSGRVSVRVRSHSRCHLVKKNHKAQCMYKWFPVQF